MARTPNNDFNEQELTNTIGKHDEELISVKKRLDSLEEKFGNNEKIADTLCETAEKALKMDEMIRKVFLKLLKKDTDIKSEVSNLVNDLDRNCFKKNLKRFGFTVWTVIIFLLGVLITAIVNKFI